VDDLAFLMAMTSASNVHGPAAYLQNTGFVLPGFPCMGAWISYGLGSLRDNVPAFVALPDPRGLPYNGRSAFTSGFLPANHQGMVINVSARDPIAHLRPPPSALHITSESRAEGLALLREMNSAHAAEHHRREHDAKSEKPYYPTHLALSDVILSTRDNDDGSQAKKIAGLIAIWERTEAALIMPKRQSRTCIIKCETEHAEKHDSRGKQPKLQSHCAELDILCGHEINPAQPSQKTDQATESQPRLRTQRGWQLYGEIVHQRRAPGRFEKPSRRK
jgi:hypothetical protein